MPHFDESQLPEGMPESIRAKIRQQALDSESQVIAFSDLFASLSADQLFTLSKLLHSFTHPDFGPQVAMHYEGWVDGMIQHVHNRCFICNKNHADEVAKGIDPHSIEEPKAEVVVDPSQEIDRSWQYPPGVEPHLTKDETEVCKIYGLDTQYTTSVDEASFTTRYAFRGFVCKQCGLFYPSTQDRALRPVDGCHGCQQKAKWG